MALVLVLGALVRVGYAFPAHKYVPDADSLNMGLRALSILDGDLVVFYSRAQIGALEAYLHAASFALLGASRETISVVPLLVGCLTLLAFYLFVQELLGRRVAAIALLFLAVPSPAYLAWTYMPNGYPETMFFCAAVLWLGTRVAYRTAERWSPLGFGLAAGLGWWNSPLTLTCTLPAVLWLLLVRREARRPQFWILPAAGFLCGAAPWIVYNLRYGFPSLSEVVRPAGSVASAADSARRFLARSLPELAVGIDPLGSGGARGFLRGALRISAAMVYLASVLLLATTLALGRKRTTLATFREGVLLLALVAIAAAGLFVFSASGQYPGPTVRYVLPLFFVIAVAAGLMSHVLVPHSRAVAGLVISAVMLFNLSHYYWPWAPQRREWAEKKTRDERLLRFLQSRGVSWICGEYWTVYPFNFLSEGRLKAVPSEPQFDFYGVRNTLPGSGGLALVGSGRERLEKWASRSRLSGKVVDAGPGYAVFLPDAVTEGSSERLYALLSRSAGPP